MPVYEFYCRPCHTIYSFQSPRVDTETRPSCPVCGEPELTKRVSIFAITRGGGDDGGGEMDDLPPGLDEDKLMRTMASMEGEMSGLDEEDPRQAARAMRRLFQESGLRPGDGMEEALARMESGEDPDQVEQELGDVLDGDDGLFGSPKASGKTLRQLRERLSRPKVDPKWYPLQSSL